MTPLNPAQEAELARLIAEQEADATERVYQREVSLDAPLFDDGDGSVLDLVVDGEQPTAISGLHRRRVTAERRKEWRWLRTTKGWAYRQIADYAGVSEQTVRAHMPRQRKVKVAAPRAFALALHEAELREAYESGARLIDIAEVFYKRVGYKTAESCYQAIRKLFKARGIPIRPTSWKHGARSRSAPDEVYRAYLKQQNRKAKFRRQQAKTPCPVLTKQGKRCKRWAMDGEDACGNHARHVQEWDEDTICTALWDWKDRHGYLPSPRDWRKATDEHPTFKTVYDVFGSWPHALVRAGLCEAPRDPSELKGLTAKQRDIVLCLDKEFNHELVKLSVLSTALARNAADHSWVGWDAGNLYGSLKRLEARSLVERVRAERGSYWRSVPPAAASERLLAVAA